MVALFGTEGSSLPGWVWCPGNDPYLRTLLVHGVRFVVYRAKAKTDRRSCWINGKQQRLGTARACVAVANKNARILWSLMAKQQVYRPAV